MAAQAAGGPAFSYSCEAAKLLADQLARFRTLNRHQLAGQAANLDFWLDEIRHALSVIDGYNARFERLKSAQTSYASEHGTIEFDLDDPCCTRSLASPPRRVPHGELAVARRTLREAAYRFLIRCHNERLIAEPSLREACARLGIGVEARDLSPPSGPLQPRRGGSQ